MPMMVVALMVVPAVVIDASNPQAPWPAIGLALNFFCWLAFLVEWVAMMIVVPNRRIWLSEHKLETLIIFVTFPILVPGVGMLRLLRLSRLLRLAWVAKKLRASLSMEGLPYVALVAFLSIIASGVLFSYVERNDHARPIGLWDGIWWASSTVTTVGSGEIDPETPFGKILALTVMLIGIGFVAILTGAVAQKFFANAEDLQPDEILLELREITERLRLLESAVEKRDERSDLEPVDAG